MVLILGIPFHCHVGVRIPNHRAPNQQLTISSLKFNIARKEHILPYHHFSGAMLTFWGVISGEMDGNIQIFGRKYENQYMVMEIDGNGYCLK